MEPVQTPDYPRGLTFEQVWASIKELRDSQKGWQEKLEQERKEHLEKLERDKKEHLEKIERDRKEWQEKFDREREAEKAEREAEKAAEKERDEKSAREWAEIEKIVRRNSKQMGDLHRKFGKLAEHLVAPGIAKRFNELGFHFDSIAPGGYRILDGQKKERTQIDILLENSEYNVAVEVKTEPVLKDIEHHIKRLEILREHRDKHNDRRIILGAIAGAIFNLDVKEAAVAASLYVLEQSGDTMKMDVPEGFVPRKW